MTNTYEDEILRLRKLLALRSGLPCQYLDDGEFQGQSHGLHFDFLNDEISDLEKKFLELNKRKFSELQDLWTAEVPTVDGTYWCKSPGKPLFLTTLTDLADGLKPYGAVLTTAQDDGIISLSDFLQSNPGCLWSKLVLPPSVDVIDLATISGVGSGA